MGTTAVFFRVVNVAKVPSFTYLGMIRPEYLRAVVFLSPLVVVGAVAGRAFLTWIPQHAFRGTVLALTAAASVALLVS